MIADGPVGRLPGDLMHASAESLDAYIAKQNRYTSLQAAALHARGTRAGAMHLALSPLARFVRFYVLKLGFLDGAAGFAHIAIGADFLAHRSAHFLIVLEAVESRGIVAFLELRRVFAEDFFPFQDVVAKLR